MKNDFQRTWPHFQNKRVTVIALIFFHHLFFHLLFLISFPSYHSPKMAHFRVTNSPFPASQLLFYLVPVVCILYMAIYPIIFPFLKLFYAFGLSGIPRSGSSQFLHLLLFFPLVLIRECSANLSPSFWFANFPTSINKKDSIPMCYSPLPHPK